MLQLYADRALLPDGWAHGVRLDIDRSGTLTGVTTGADSGGAERASGPVMPGIPNLHSHAFQRAMAGLAERGLGQDSFWTWREVMYRFVGRLTPEQAEAVAAQLYVEMLKAGYTAVGEFHYLHHDRDGSAYADLAEMARRVLAAARRTGLGMTMLPVLYGHGGFGGQPAGEGQRRFLNTPERLLRIVSLLRDDIADDADAALGVAPHSLRAVTPETLREVVAGAREMDARAPIHIHVAEQTREVADCEAWCGKRPVAYLLESDTPPDEHWCLVHATHMTPEETAGLAASGAVAGLCPTTEANLGDGLFPAPDYLAAGGRFGIGSDSHVSVSPIEELRWLEYGQRLATRRRNVLAHEDQGGSVGASLVHRTLDGGAQALGRPIGRLAPGCRADLVVLDETSPALAGQPDHLLLDAFVFAGNINPVRDVMVGGRWVVTEGHHGEEADILETYRGAVSELRKGD